MSVSPPESVGTKSSKKNGNTIHSSSPAIHWLCTVNNYLPIDIKCILLNKEICSYAFQHEVGESGTPHLQAYIKFHKKTRPIGLFSKRFHWEKVKNIMATIEYCSSTGEHREKPHGKQWTNIPWVAEHQKTDNLWVPLRPWQSHVLARIYAENDDRKIWVVVDSIGNKGKSWFARHICEHENAIILSGKSADMKYGVSKKVHLGMPPDWIIFDVPRTNVDYLCYSGIEEIKNGCFFSPKFDGDMCLMKSPICLLLMNEMPDLSSMSADRWKNSIINLDYWTPPVNSLDNYLEQNDNIYKD